jgi:hypothetical protein
MRQRLRQLQEALESLEITVEQDRPGGNGVGDDVIVAARMNDAFLAAKGYLVESLAAAADACGAVAPSFDPNHAQRALTRCQERFHQFAGCFANELASCDRIDDLKSVGKEHGRRWQDWVVVVTESLDRCRPLLDDVQAAFLLSWRDLAERMTMLPLQIQMATHGLHHAAMNTADDATSSTIMPGWRETG